MVTSLTCNTNTFLWFQIPPVLVALVSENLEILVRITGSFAGAGIQYIIPAFLVYFARKEVQKLPLGDPVNLFASPFSGTSWVIIVLLWAAACILLVLINFFESWPISTISFAVFLWFSEFYCTYWGMNGTLLTVLINLLLLQQYFYISFLLFPNELELCCVV